MRTAAGLVLLLGALACSKADEPAPVDSAAPGATPLPDTVRSSASDATERGVGAVSAGMTLAALDSLPGIPARTKTLESRCDYVNASRAGDSVLAMIIDGRVARVDIQDTSVQTSLGVRIGDTEAVVKERYAGRIAETPHKYTDGHYLTVTPAAPADSAYRLIFETDGQRVTRYRAGLLPAVGWVESCS